MDTPPDPPLLALVREALNVRRPAAWPWIADASGVPLATVVKIAKGHTKNPGITNVERLREHFGIALVRPRHLGGKGLG
jgi:hypothetical protein